MIYDSGNGRKLYEVLDVFQEVGLPSPVEDRKLKILDNYYDTVDFRKLKDYFVPCNDHLTINIEKFNDLRLVMDEMSKRKKKYIISHVDTGICGEYDYKPVLHGVLQKKSPSGKVKDILVVKLNLVTHTVEIDNWMSKDIKFSHLQQLVSFINRKWKSDFTLEEFLTYFYEDEISYKMVQEIDDWVLMPEYGLYSSNIAEATFDQILEELTQHESN